MANYRSVLKTALITTVLLAVIHSGSTALPEKLANCCTAVSPRKITMPITGYMIQKAHPPCVPAVIFQTETEIFCSYAHAPWVRAKIYAFEKAKAQATRPPVAPSSTASLLSIITSTASPSSPSTTPTFTTSFPSTTEMPAEEISSGNNDE